MKKIFTPLLILSCFAGLKNSVAQLSPCANLFISEYVKGTSNNKAIELFNPSPVPITFSSNYKLVTCYNGGASYTSINLVGNVSAGGTFVICNTSAAAAVTSIAQQQAGGLTFTGNDGIALIKILSSVTFDTLDRIGQWAVDPGAAIGWPVDTGNTINHTLVRKPAVTFGQLNWTTGATEWLAFGLDDFTHLGAHSMNPCQVTLNPILSFSLNAQNFGEAGGSVIVTVNILNPSASATSVTISDLGTGTATSGTDYTYSPAQTVSFAASSSTPQTISIPITNDALVEGNETIILGLTGANNGATFGVDSVQIITIIDDDALTNPTVSFQNSHQSVNEGGGSVNIAITIVNPNANITHVTAQFVLAGSTATPVSDFTFNNTTVAFPGGSSLNQNLTIPIIDDAIYEGNEIFILHLVNADNNASIGIALDTITIVENDPNAVDNLNWQNTIDVYPNPVSQILFLGQPVKYSSVEIVNLLGEVVKNISLTNEDMLKINVGDLNSGIYFIRISTGKEMVEKKFVKQ